MDSGMVNATALCRELNPKKLIADWLRLASTRALLDRRCAEVSLTRTDLVKTVRGGPPEQQGTWIHPSLADEFRRWATLHPAPAFTRDEVKFGERLDTVFAGLLEFERQFPVNSYRIDFYSREARIAVEFDERRHEWAAHQDRLRQEEITVALQCTLVRVQHGREDEGINAILLALRSQQVL